jgi:hypothetical protein
VAGASVIHLEDGFTWLRLRQIIITKMDIIEG